MIKVGYITSSLSSVDGWGRYSKGLVEAASNFVEVKAVITDATTGNETFVSPVYAKLSRFSYSPATQLKALYYALKYFRGCDIIHSLMETAAPVAALASKILGARFIMSFHGTGALPSPKKISLARPALIFAYHNAAIAITGSIDSEKKVREKVNFGECRFIPQGVDPGIFHVLSDASDKNFLLTVGWLKERKGMDTLVKVLILLKDEFPNLNCKIVGSSKDPKFFNYLKDLAREGGVENRVQFLGRVTEDELVRLYNDCSVVVLPARDFNNDFEGCSLTFDEANACGAPVVTTRGFGSEYAIKNGYNGFLVDDPEDVAAFAQAVKKIISDKNRHSEMRENALNIIKNRSWETIVKTQLVKVHEDALSKNK